MSHQVPVLDDDASERPGRPLSDPWPTLTRAVCGYLETWQRGGRRDSARLPAVLPAPGVAHLVHRLPDAEMIEDFDGGAGAAAGRERMPHRRAAAVIRPVDDHKPALRAPRRIQQVPGGGAGEQAVPQHRREAVVRYRNPFVGGRGSR